MGGEVVRGSVEERLDGLLESESDQLCRAKRYLRVVRKDLCLVQREPGKPGRLVPEAPPRSLF